MRPTEKSCDLYGGEGCHMSHTRGPHASDQCTRCGFLPGHLPAFLYWAFNQMEIKKIGAMKKNEGFESNK